MHQQPRATEQPVPLKTTSRSDQRSGVRGATVSFMGFLQFDGAQQCGELNHEFWPGFQFVSARNMALRNHRNWAKGRCNRNCVTFAPVRFPPRHRPTPVMNEHFDVIIIGTGAGGGTLAYRLAASGKRILLIERGPYVPREKDNWSTKAVNQDGKYNTKEVWRDRDGKDLHPHTNYYVGGNTKFYGSALFRLRKEDFGEIRHHGGVSPAWPISYEELEPYYVEAERLYHVHG